MTSLQPQSLLEQFQHSDSSQKHFSYRFKQDTANFASSNDSDSHKQTASSETSTQSERKGYNYTTPDKPYTNPNYELQFSHTNIDAPEKQSYITPYSSRTQFYSNLTPKTEKRTVSSSPPKNNRDRSPLGLNSGSRLDHFLLQKENTTKEILFPDTLMDSRTPGQQLLTTSTSYPVRRPLNFDNSNHLKEIYKYFSDDHQQMKQNKVKFVLRKKSAGTSQQNSVNNLDAPPAQHRSSIISRGSSSEANSLAHIPILDLSIYQLNENYRFSSAISKKDPLSTWLLHKSDRGESRGSFLGAMSSDRSSKEAKEASFLGPWCKKQVKPDKLGDKNGFISSRKVSDSKSTKNLENGYLDHYILNKLRKNGENPRFQWYIPDTEIFDPMDAILWPQPRLSTQMYLEKQREVIEVESKEEVKFEQPPEEAEEEEEEEEEVYQDEDEDSHASIEPLRPKKSVHHVYRKPQKMLLVIEENDENSELDGKKISYEEKELIPGFDVNKFEEQRTLVKTQKKQIF